MVMLIQQNQLKMETHARDRHIVRGMNGFSPIKVYFRGSSLKGKTACMTFIIINQ